MIQPDAGNGTFAHHDDRSKRSNVAFREWMQRSKTTKLLALALLLTGSIELLWALNAGLIAWGMITIPTMIGSLLWVAVKLQTASIHDSRAKMWRGPLVVIVMFTALDLQVMASLTGNDQPVDAFAVFKQVFVTASLFVSLTFLIGWTVKQRDIGTIQRHAARAWLIVILIWTVLYALAYPWLAGITETAAPIAPSNLNSLSAFILLVLSFNERLRGLTAFMVLVLVLPTLAVAQLFSSIDTQSGHLLTVAMLGSLWPKRRYILVWPIAVVYFGFILWFAPGSANAANLLIIAQSLLLLAAMHWLRSITCTQPETATTDDESRPSVQERYRSKVVLISSTAITLSLIAATAAVWNPELFVTSSYANLSEENLLWLEGGLLIFTLSIMLVSELLRRKFEHAANTRTRLELENLRKILEGVDVGVTLIDSETRCVMANLASETGGEDVSELAGTRLDQYPQWFESGLAGAFEEVMMSGNVIHLTLERPTSVKRRNLQMRISRIEINNKKHVLIQSIDITQLMDQQQQIDAAREQHDKIARLAHIGEGKRDFINNTISFDRIASEWLGLGDGTKEVTMSVSDYRELLDPDALDDFREFETIVSDPNISYLRQNRHLRTPSGERFLQFHLSIERDQNGAPLVARTIIIDQTELRQALNKIETVSKAREQFISNMNHELRTPLNAVLGFSMLLKQANLDPRNKSHVEKLVVASKRLHRMVEDILDIQSLSHDELTLHVAPFLIGDILKHAQHLFEERCTAKGVRFISNVRGADNQLELLGDAPRINQILFHLLDNAVKFTDSGHIALTVFISQPMDGSDQVEVRFSIVDTGTGMPEHLLHSIDLLQQSDETTTKRHAGIGAGLTIVRMLIKEMQGVFELSSELGAGTRAEVSLMLCAPEAQSETSGQPSKPSGESSTLTIPDLTGYTILAVDDSDIYRDTVEALLSQTGATVKTMEHGLEALDWMHIEGNNADLILLDLRMEIMDGLEFISTINSDPATKDTPIIVISNYDSPSTVEQALALGANEFMLKPFDTVQLFRSISQTLGVDTRSASAPDARPNGPTATNDGSHPLSRPGHAARRTSDETEQLSQRVERLIQSLERRELESLTLYAALRPNLVPLLSDKQLQDLDSAIQKLRFGWVIEILRYLNLDAH